MMSFESLETIAMQGYFILLLNGCTIKLEIVIENKCFIKEIIDRRNWMIMSSCSKPEIFKI